VPQEEKAGAKTIFIKDAHDSGCNLIFSKLPDNAILHRGWEGSPKMMMEGLDSTFDAVIFIGYHSGMLSEGNSLAHTMSLKIHRISINGEIASEFLINAYYASLIKVPIVFLSGDLALTETAKKTIPALSTVATKTGLHGANTSIHPNRTNQEIEDKVYSALSRDYSNNIIKLPEEFYIEIEYRTHQEAYSASFFPGCKLIKSNVISFHSKNYYDVLVLFKFVL
jgi:D-amino peptidase